MVARTVGIEIESAALNAALARLTTVLTNPSAAMDQIGRYLVASTLRRFERERAPDGSPWLKSARALAEGGQTLTDTGRLRGSIAHTVTDGARAVEVGSKVLYAAIHQFGGRAGRGRRVTLPARPYLGIRWPCGALAGARRPRLQHGCGLARPLERCRRSRALGGDVGGKRRLFLRRVAAQVAARATAQEGSPCHSTACSTPSSAPATDAAMSTSATA